MSGVLWLALAALLASASAQSAITSPQVRTLNGTIYLDVLQGQVRIMPRHMSASQTHTELCGRTWSLCSTCPTAPQSARS